MYGYCRMSLETTVVRKVEDCHENLVCVLSGPAGPIMSNMNGPPDHSCCHKWSGQNINGPGEQPINSAHSK